MDTGTVWSRIWSYKGGNTKSNGTEKSEARFEPKSFRVSENVRIMCFYFDDE